MLEIYITEELKFFKENKNQYFVVISLLEMIISLGEAYRGVKKPLKLCNQLLEAVSTLPLSEEGQIQIKFHCYNIYCVTIHYM